MGKENTSPADNLIRQVANVQETLLQEAYYQAPPLMSIERVLAVKRNNPTSHIFLGADAAKGTVENLLGDMNNLPGILAVIKKYHQRHYLFIPMDQETLQRFTQINQGKRGEKRVYTYLSAKSIPRIITSPRTVDYSHYREIFFAARNPENNVEIFTNVMPREECGLPEIAVQLFRQIS